MELQGAALELHAQGAAAAAAGLLGARNTQQKLGDLRHVLVHTLCQAACVFPARRVPCGGGPRRWVCGAIRSTGGGGGIRPGHRGPGARRLPGSPVCMPLAALEAVGREGGCAGQSDARTHRPRQLQQQAEAWGARGTAAPRRLLGLPAPGCPGGGGSRGWGCGLAGDTDGSGCSSRWRHRRACGWVPAPRAPGRAGGYHN